MKTKLYSVFSCPQTNENTVSNNDPLGDDPQEDGPDYPSYSEMWGTEYLRNYDSYSFGRFGNADDYLTGVHSIIFNAVADYRWHTGPNSSRSIFRRVSMSVSIDWQLIPKNGFLMLSFQNGELQSNLTYDFETYIESYTLATTDPDFNPFASYVRFMHNIFRGLGDKMGFRSYPWDRLVLNNQQIIFYGASNNKFYESLGGKFDPEKNTWVVELSDILPILNTLGYQGISRINDGISPLTEAIKFLSEKYNDSEDFNSFISRKYPYIERKGADRYIRIRDDSSIWIDGNQALLPFKYYYKGPNSGTKWQKINKDEIDWSSYDFEQIFKN